MNYLLIGGASLFGPFLLEELCKEDNHIVVTRLPHEGLKISGKFEDYVEVVELDILNRDSIDDLFKRIRPEVIFNFAVQNSVRYAWEHPDETIEINVNGLLNLLDAVRKLDYSPKIVVAGSGEEYGELPFSAMPVDESVSQNPTNIFAASKVCQTMMCELYAKAYKMDIVVLCTFNEIGPGQGDRFVVSDLCHQFARIEAGKKEAKVEIGNINVIRDFTDVRDIVRAFEIASRYNLKNIKYNVGRGKAIPISEIIRILENITGIKAKIEIKSERVRLIDSAILESDPGALYRETGWKSEISIENTVLDMLNFWRDLER